VMVGIDRLGLRFEHLAATRFGALQLLISQVGHGYVPTAFKSSSRRSTTSANKR
jgi:hypothetical protein